MATKPHLSVLPPLDALRERLRLVPSKHLAAFRRRLANGCRGRLPQMAARDAPTSMLTPNRRYDAPTAGQRAATASLAGGREGPQAFVGSFWDDMDRAGCRAAQSGFSQKFQRSANRPDSNFMTKKAKFSIRQLAIETGNDRGSIAKWLEGRNPANKKEALRIIGEHTRAGAPGADPKTGLSWSAAAKRETALRLRRENEEATAIQERIWFPTAEMLTILRAVVTRLEGFPAKVASEAGLSDSQVATVQRNIDDLRSQIADDIAALQTPEKGEA